MTKIHLSKVSTDFYFRYGRYRRLAYTAQSPNSGGNIGRTTDRGTDPMLASTSTHATSSTYIPTRASATASLARAGAKSSSPLVSLGIWHRIVDDSDSKPANFDHRFWSDSKSNDHFESTIAISI